MLSGQLGIGQATREAFRRGRTAVRSRRERALLDELRDQPARLTSEFQKLSTAELLNHFRNRTSPKFFPGFETENIWSRNTDYVPSLFLATLASSACPILEHRWELLGFGEKDFGQPINWHRDPLSGRSWPLDYHADIPLWHNDGSDIRALWELNRLGHLVTLGGAYAVIKANAPNWKEFGEIMRAEGLDWTEHPDWNPDVAEEFFLQVESWHEQNPLGRGANWACAMEVALRSMNLLTAFRLFRSSPRLSEARLLLLLKMFDQHGAHIQRNLEFSHVTTSNHYLSDLAGLLWLGIMLPELSAAAAWREWALAELLREMDKQILDDGADYEAATAYHRFVLELFLYSFLLCRANEIEIAEKYWSKLHAMLDYLGAIPRTGTKATLIGDSDDSYVWPSPVGVEHERGLLTIGAVVFADPKLLRSGSTTELLWVLGDEGTREAARLWEMTYKRDSRAFPNAGMYVLRRDEECLVFNASSPQAGRPASHRHNDALSVDISAHGCAFVVDPGTYVYTADLSERQLFRSTAYHSTIQIDNEEQQTIRVDEPFKNGAEAKVRVLKWTSTQQQDRVIAEHIGYERLRDPVTHRRTVTFNKIDRWWFIEDELSGRGRHSIAARFHFDAGLEVGLYDEQSVIVKDPLLGAQLFVGSWGASDGLRLELEPQFVSRRYGEKLPSTTARWSIEASVPYKLRWAIVPIGAAEDRNERLGVFRVPALA
ncbi:MAG TPA: alginate lyase family protein [Pyrinomonadaceae bacterium]|nr:alginate lyase family protein [Pyrinomonadaceae bacterium]